MMNRTRTESSHSPQRGLRSERSKLLPLVVVLAVTAVILIFPTWVGGQEGASEPEEAIAAGGYSIFHETMVDMPWTDVERAAKDGAIVLLPTGVIEEHGPHMGCGVDTYGAYLLCKIVRRQLAERGIEAVIAPPLYWGINRTTHVFPGTFTVREETMKALLHDILASLKSWGFTKVFNINGHLDGYHCMAVLQAMSDARRELDMETFCVLSEMLVQRFRLSGDEPFVLVHGSPETGGELTDVLDIHAGAGETSFVAAFLPEYVDVERARAQEATDLSLGDITAWISDARETTPGGYLGDPARFDPEGVVALTIEECGMIADEIAAQLEPGD